MRPNLRYLQEGSATDVMDTDGNYDPYDPESAAEFAEEMSGANVPALTAAPPPGGWSLVGGLAPNDNSDYYVPGYNSPAGIATAAPSGNQSIVNSTVYPVSRASAADPFAPVEKQGVIAVPNAGFSSRPTITPDDSGYTPGALPAPSGPVSDMLADVPGPFQNRVIGKDTTLQGALETARQTAAEQPIRQAPKWWEGLAAGAIGGMAGYSNAARRAAPIDIKSVTEPILYPGYEGKLAAWQSRMNAANEQVQNLGQQIGAQYAGQKVQSEAQLRAAQAAAAMAHGEYWASRSEQERAQWKIDPKTGELFNTISGQYAARPPTAQDRQQTALALLTAAKDPDAASKAAYYALNGKLPPPAPVKVPTEANAALSIRATGGVSGNPQIDALTPQAAKQAIELGKDRAPRDPFTDWMRQQTFNAGQQKDLEAIGNKKDQDLARISAQRQAEIERVIGQGTTEQDVWDSKDPRKVAQLNAINRRFAPQIQGVSDAYSSAARSHNIPAPKYAVNPDTLQYTQVVNPYGNNPYRPGQ